MARLSTSWDPLVHLSPHSERGFTQRWKTRPIHEVHAASPSLPLLIPFTRVSLTLLFLLSSLPFLHSLLLTFLLSFYTQTCHAGCFFFQFFTFPFRTIAAIHSPTLISLSHLFPVYSFLSTLYPSFHTADLIFLSLIPSDNAPARATVLATSPPLSHTRYRRPCTPAYLPACPFCQPRAPPPHSPPRVSIACASTSLFGPHAETKVSSLG